jgi:hypothetical protein
VTKSLSVEKDNQHFAYNNTTIENKYIDIGDIFEINNLPTRASFLGFCIVVDSVIA